MNYSIRKAEERDLPRLIEITLAAFKPIFESFARILGPDIYRKIYPDWEKIQADGVREVFDNNDLQIRTAVSGTEISGFIVYGFKRDGNTGEISFLAVDPCFQNKGIGTDLTNSAMTEMQQQGISLIVTTTGGDPSHAPARRAYEKAGFTALPLTRFYRKL